MKRFLLFAGLAVCGLGSSPVAAAQSVFDTPPGSWRNTCRGGVVINGRLNAQCEDSRGFPRNAYIEVAACEGREIVNNNGTLTCAPPNDGGRQWGRSGAGGRSITVYQHTNFQGASRTYNGVVANLVPEGWNDVISSARVSGNWEVCTDANFGGRCQVFDADVANVVPLGLNDVISSIRPAGRSQASITVFQHTNFSGASRTYSGPVANLVPDGWNDVISSMTLRGRWEVCTDVNFGGRCQLLDADVANVVPLGLNDVISSIRPASR